MNLTSDFMFTSEQCISSVPCHILITNGRHAMCVFYHMFHICSEKCVPTLHECTLRMIRCYASDISRSFEYEVCPNLPFTVLKITMKILL